MLIHRLLIRAEGFLSEVEKLPHGPEYDALRLQTRALLQELRSRAHRIPDIEIPPPDVSDALVVHSRAWQI